MRRSVLLLFASTFVASLLGCASTRATVPPLAKIAVAAEGPNLHGTRFRVVVTDARDEKPESAALVATTSQLLARELERRGAVVTTDGTDLQVTIRKYEATFDSGSWMGCAELVATGSVGATPINALGAECQSRGNSFGYASADGALFDAFGKSLSELFQAFPAPTEPTALTGSQPQH